MHIRRRKLLFKWMLRLRRGREGRIKPSPGSAESRPFATKRVNCHYGPHFGPLEFVYHLLSLAGLVEKSTMDPTIALPCPARATLAGVPRIAVAALFAI